MTYFKNTNIWFWGFIILLIINISVIASMAFVMYSFHKDADYTAFHKRVIKSKRANTMHSKGTKSLIMKLNLNADQKREMGAIRKEHFQEMRKLKRALRINQHQLFEEASSDKPDSTLIAEYREKNIEIQEKIIDESLIFFKKIRQDLDKEQQALLKAHYEDKFKRTNNTQNK